MQKRWRQLLAISLLLLAPSVWAASIVDSFVFGFSPRTGDAFLDTQLGDINVLVRGTTDGFIDDVVVRFGAPRTLVRTYVVERRWAPADVYYGCAIAQQLRRNCADVLRIYERDHRLGWGAVAQRLGIRPGSPAFHALKGKVGNGHTKYKDDDRRRRGNRGHGQRGENAQGERYGRDDKGKEHGQHGRGH